MSIQGPASLLDPRASTFPTSHVAAPAVVEPVSPTSAVTATVSVWAQLLSKLQQLHEQNPAALKEMAGRMAESAKTAAGSATGDEKQSLARLGERLAHVATTGNIAVFRPTHHHHHHAPAQPSGEAPSFLRTLLDQIDHVLGPGATQATGS
jgi:hypothetical protein